MSLALKEMDLLDVPEEELAASAPQKRNWCGILTAVAMILFISSLILVAIFFVTPLDGNVDDTKKPISLKDAISPSIMGQIEALEWLDANKLLMRVNENVEVVDFGAEGRRNWTLFDMEVMYRYGKVKSTSVIPNTAYIEVTYVNEKNKPNIYETQTTKRIYDTNAKTFENVGPEKTGNENVDALKFSPRGVEYVFVHNYNLYYRPSMGSNELIQLTQDGNTDYRHGLTDWAYNEEIFGPEAFWWSPDSEEVGYLTTNLTGMPTYNISWYGGKLYPDQQMERYAKVGARNLEQIQLRIWQKSTKRTVDLNVELPRDQQVYLMHASYARFHNTNVLIAVFANRFQDEVTYTMCTLKTGKCVASYHQSYEVGNMHQYAQNEHITVAAYVDDSFFTILPFRRPGGDVFNQIARIRVPPDFRHAQEQFLSIGDQEVDKIHAYNPNTEQIYFTSPAPIHRQLHLYSTSALPQSNLYQAHCVTCNVSANCTYHESTFAPNSTKFFMNCKGIGPTTIFVADIKPNNTLDVLVEFGQTSEREQELVSKKFPHVHFENVTLASGFVAFVRIFLPHGVTIETTHKKYPLLVYVYGGPNSHNVHEEWLPEMPVDIYFASTLEYIIVNIDGRGSGNAGWRRRQALYGHLGTVEVDDQIETTRLLLDKYKFIDRKRSYGGFVTAHAIARDDQHTFKCAAMIAPVVYFKMYDAIYTERYMGNASEHAYDLTNVAKNVTNFHFVRTLLVHGTGDDNVHFQNTAELISAFVRENVQFSLMVYPDERHSLKGVRPHLFETIISFFRNCIESPPLLRAPQVDELQQYKL